MLDMTATLKVTTVSVACCIAMRCSAIPGEQERGLLQLLSKDVNLDHGSTLRVATQQACMCCAHVRTAVNITNPALIGLISLAGNGWLLAAMA